MYTEIVADIDETTLEIVIWLHWAGGVHTSLRVAKNRTGKHRRCANRKVVDLVGELVKIYSDANIASILNRLGYRTGADNSWFESGVRSFRNTHKIAAAPSDSSREWLTLADAACELEISAPSVCKLIKLGLLPAKQVIVHAPWVIERKNVSLPAV